MLALLVLTTCGSCNDPLFGHDAGVEHDAGKDAGEDSGQDSGVDAGGARDANVPANEWWSVPGTEDCLQVATQPAQVLAELRIEPCVDPPNSCREAVVEWAGSLDRGDFRVLDAQRFASGGVIAFRRDTPDEWQQTFVARDDGTIEAAFRGPDSIGEATLCNVGPVAVSESRIAIDIARYAGPDLRPPIIVSAPRSAPAEARVVKEFTAEEPATAGQELSASDEVIGVEMMFGPIWRIDADGTSAVIGGPPFGEGEAHLEAVTGDAVFYTTGPSPIVLRVSTPAGVSTLLGSTEAEVAFFRTDGRDMVWEQFTTPTGFLTWERVELWTAPYATSGPISGRLVRRLPTDTFWRDFIVGAGRVLIGELDGSAAAYTLDGTLLETFPGSITNVVDLLHGYSAADQIAFPFTSRPILPAHRTFRWLSR